MITEKQVKILYWTDGDGNFRASELLDILNSLSENIPINLSQRTVEYLTKKNLIQSCAFGGWLAKNENDCIEFLSKISDEQIEFRRINEQLKTMNTYNPDTTKMKRLGEINGSAKMTSEKVRELRRKYAAKEATQVTLAAEYGLSVNSTRNIILCVTWNHVK